MEVADSTPVEVFLLDQRQVRVSFHLREGLLPRHELVTRFADDLTLVDSSGHLHLTHGGANSSCWGQVLPLGVLAEGGLLGIDHVAVV